MRQTIDSLLFKTINESTNQSSDSEIFCPEERIKELELRTQRRNNFEEELFKDKFPTEEELAYHKELLGEPQPPFSTLDPKIRRGDPCSLKIPCVIEKKGFKHVLEKRKGYYKACMNLGRTYKRDRERIEKLKTNQMKEKSWKDVISDEKKLGSS
ncbi:hypothetical protein Tco_0781908 [Tanacetum coccineum]